MSSRSPTRKYTLTSTSRIGSELDGGTAAVVGAADDGVSGPVVGGVIGAELSGGAAVVAVGTALVSTAVVSTVEVDVEEQALATANNNTDIERVARMTTPSLSASGPIVPPRGGVAPEQFGQFSTASRS